jgi:hypothetical protein
MIDACLFAAAAEDVAGFAKGAVVKAYRDSKAEAVVTVAEDPIVKALFEVIGPDTIWEGQTGELLDQLTEERKGADGKKPLSRRWPTEARGLTAALRRLETTLRVLGFHIVFPTGTGGGDQGKARILTITRRTVSTAVPVSNAENDMQADRRNGSTEVSTEKTSVSDDPTIPTVDPQHLRNGDTELFASADAAPSGTPTTLDWVSSLFDKKWETTVGTVGSSEVSETQAQNLRRSVPTIGATVGNTQLSALGLSRMVQPISDAERQALIDMV